MRRRTLIQAGFGTAALGALASARGEATACADARAGGVYHTADHPGRWAKKVGSHLPRLEKAVAPDGSRIIRVTTDHGMSGYRHYIVKHQLLDAQYRFLGERFFDPEKDEAVSEYRLPADYRGPVYALSLCNKHDLWLNRLDV